MPAIESGVKNIVENKQSSSSGSRRSPRNKVSKTPLSRPPGPKPSPLSPASLSSISSSSSSSSTLGSSASSLFDSSPNGLGTPLTPPVVAFEGSNLRDGKQSNFSKKGTSAPPRFIKKLLETDTPIAAPTSGKSSPSSAAVQSIVGAQKDFGLEGDDDGLSTRLRELTLDESDSSEPPSSPSPSTKAQSKRRGRADVKVAADYFPPMILEGQLDNKSKPKGISRSSEATKNIPESVPSASMTGTLESLQGLNLGKRTPNSSKKKYPATLNAITKQVNDEAREVIQYNSSDSDSQPDPSPENSSDSDSHPDPSPEKRRAGKTARSGPQMAHQRSVSLHTIRDDRSGPDPITVAATAPERSSGAASSSIKSHNLRRRSTGSLDEFEGASPSNIETLIESDEKLGHGTAPAELSNNPRPSRKKEQENLDLQHYNKWKKDPQSLKSVILDAIRDKSVSKYARLRTVRRHLANIWKALTNTTAKLPRTPIIEEDGYIYIYKSKNAFPGPKYVKIGKTRQAPNERIYKWETSCKFECIPIKDNNDKRFLHYHAVERIVHAELYNERRKYKCNECNQAHKLGFGAKYAKSPSTEHGEWFEISEEKALQVVNKWRDWVIKSDPYRPDGRIRARWLWKCTLGSFWMNGTEEDWIVWRDLNSLEIFRCVSNHFKKWLDVVLPPTVELLMARGAIFGLAPVWYFWAWGFNFGTCVVFLTAVLTLVYLCLTFC